MSFLKKYVILISLVEGVYSTLRIDPLVHTNVGLIRGQTATDGDYSMFLGIPFAQVNESNPFGVSNPYPRFEDTFNAYDDSASCPQIDLFDNTLSGNLDCLQLNVYVPFNATFNNRLPVLVWFYGGAFRVGNAKRQLYGPRFLVRHDIILVTVNYRLGPYGFMCLDIPEVPGNSGIKDQLLALRWVHDNIDAFGGDSSKITIQGESAGARSVDYHLLSKHEKLYDKAILQSSNSLSLSPIMYDEPIHNAPQMIAVHLGFPTNDVYEAIEFLSKIDTNLVIAATNALGILNNFRPCIEKVFKGVDGMITENWITAEIPKVLNMPILIGFNNDERFVTHYYGNDEYIKNLNVVHENLANGFDVDNEEFKGMHEVVYHFYFGDEPMGENVKREVIDLESDFMYICPTYRAIERYIKNGAGNIYLYVFSYVGERNFMRNLLNVNSDDGGASHADELTYLFDAAYMKNLLISDDDQQLIDRMTTMWANFVKFGNPTPQIIDNMLTVQWPAITNGSLIYYMDIDSELSVGTRPFNQRSIFWDLFFKKNRHLQRAYIGANVEL